MSHIATINARAEAVELYRTVGPLEAARRTGFADGTIRRWAQAAGARAPRHGNDWTAIRECSETDAAYLAGIVDGEGCISIGRRKHVERGGRPRYSLDLVVINTDIGVMRWLQARFGGNVRTNRQADIVHAECYRWRASNLQAEELLKRIRPFMVIKARQADVALRFRATFADHACRFNMPTEAKYAERETLREEIQFLNRRGPKGLVP